MEQASLVVRCGGAARLIKVSKVALWDALGEELVDPDALKAAGAALYAGRAQESIVKAAAALLIGPRALII